MSLNEYQEDVWHAQRSSSRHEQLDEAVLGMQEEMGEVARLYHRSKYREERYTDHEFALELGDHMFYVAQAAYAIGYTLDDVARLNMRKRRERRRDAI